MSAASLWLEATELGIRLEAAGGKLRVDAPAGALTPELRTRLAQEKTQLLQWLARPPLSFAQQRMWMLHKLAPTSPAYNVAVAVRLRGTLDVGALWSALDELVRRHAVLRTRYPTGSGAPWADVLPAAPSTPMLRSIRAEDLGSVLAEECRRPFDLERDAPWRPVLFQLGDGDHVLHVGTHHVAVDGWSLQVLVAELTALLSGQTLPSPSLSFIDHARRERAEEEAGRLESGLAHWKRRLEGGLEPLALPFDRERPAVPGAGDVLPLRLGDLGSRVGELAKRSRATPFAVYLAAYAATLHRWTGQPLVPLGTVVSNRQGKGADTLVGTLANTLVLRLAVEPGDLFDELVRRAADELIDAFEHADLPFERIVQQVEHGGAAPGGLLQAVLMLQRPSTTPLTLGGLTIEPLEAERGTSRFDLTLQLAQDGAELGGSIEYASDLFDRTTVERLARSFTAVLTHVVERPRTAVRDLPAFAVEELREAARLGVGAPGDPTDVVEQLRRVASTHPAGIAVDAHDLTLTHRQLVERAAVVAGRLARAGLGPERVAALRLPRSGGLVVSMLAALWCGGAFAVLDEGWPADRVEATLARLAPTVLVDRSWLDAAGDEASSPIEPVPVTPETLAYVIFTSGSTGEPKGVLVPRRGIGNLVTAQVEAFGIRPGDGVLQFAAAGFDAIVSEVFATLGGAATVVIRSRGELMPGEPLARTLREVGAAVVTLPPSAALVMPDVDLPSLHTLVLAGEACPAAAVARWSVGGRRVVNAYGPTEITVCATMATCIPGERPPIGHVIRGARADVVDPDGGRVPVGVWGELVVGGIGVARGYLGRAELTAERFVPSLDEPGLRAYRTGDRVRWRSDGQLELSGRFDDQIKVRGFRIEPGEIEAALRAAPGVSDAVVAGVGEDAERRLVAWVVGETADEADLRRRLAGTLPPYMVPGQFVRLARLPTTTSGKVDRGRLVRELSRPLEVVEPDPVLDALEAEILRLWRTALGVATATWRDDFLVAGGHSLAAVRLVEGLRQRFGLRLPLAEVLGGATPQGLAVRIRLATGAASASLGDSATGAATVVMVPGLGGEPAPYAPLAIELAGRHPVIALRHVAADGGCTGDDLDEVVARLAADVAARLATAPGAPCVLVGWSLGGLLALHLASALERSGVEPRAVVVLDPRFDAPTLDGDTLRTAVVGMAERLGPAGGDASRALEILRDAGLLPPTTSGTEEDLRRLAAQTRWAAAPVAPVRAAVVAVQPSRGDLASLDVACRRLQELAPRLRVERVEADHASLLDAATAAALAAIVTGAAADPSDSRDDATEGRT